MNKLTLPKEFAADPDEQSPVPVAIPAASQPASQRSPPIPQSWLQQDGKRQPQQSHAAQQQQQPQVKQQQLVQQGHDVPHVSTIFDMILNDYDQTETCTARPSPTKTPDSVGTTAMAPTSQGSSKQQSARKTSACAPVTPAKRSKTTSAPVAIVNIEDDSDLELLQDAAGFVPVESHGKKAVAKAKAIAKQSLKHKQQNTKEQKKQQAETRAASKPKLAADAAAKKEFAKAHAKAKNAKTAGALKDFMAKSHTSTPSKSVAASLLPGGCGRCRWSEGCTNSCWKIRLGIK